MHKCVIWIRVHKRGSEDLATRGCQTLEFNGIERLSQWCIDEASKMIPEFSIFQAV
jgi:hypothetical protein